MHSVGNHLIVPHQALLGGLVVIGGYHQQSVGPGPLRVPGERDGIFRGVGSAAGDYRNPAVHVLLSLIHISGAGSGIPGHAKGN